MSLRLGGNRCVRRRCPVGSPGGSGPALDPADSGSRRNWLFLVGVVALLVGLAGLSAFQARRHPALVWAAFLLPAIGGAVMTFGVVVMSLLPDRPVVGELVGWDFFIVGTARDVAGSVLFAIATYRPGHFRTRGPRSSGITSAISLVSFFGSFVFGEWLQPVFVAGFLAFPIGWVVLGLQAIRLDRPAVATGAA